MSLIWQGQSTEKSLGKGKELIMSETSRSMPHTEESSTGSSHQNGESVKVSDAWLSPEKQTHSVRSAVPSQILGQVESSMMNSVDSCVEQLSGLMKYSRKVLDDAEEPLVLTPNLINSAANCASQIQKLLRLKLDVMKLSVGQ